MSLIEFAFLLRLTRAAAHDKSSSQREFFGTPRGLGLTTAVLKKDLQRARSGSGGSGLRHGCALHVACWNLGSDGRRSIQFGFFDIHAAWV